MERRWPQPVAPLGVLSIALAAACGSGGGVYVGQASSGSGHPGSGQDASIDDLDGGSGDDGDPTTGDGAGNDGDTGDGGNEGGEAGATRGALDAGGGTDTGTDAGGESDGAVSEGGATTEGGTSCDFSGTWASQMAIDVTWAAGGIFDIVIAPGSGTIKQWLLSTRTVSGTTTTETARVCGIDLPDFHGNAALVNETWGIRFPDSLFSGTDLGTFPIRGTLSGSATTLNTMPSLNTEPAAALLGLTLANPTTAVWPGTITTGIDQDGDGEGGVTADVAQGGGFSNIPLDFTVVYQPKAVVRGDRVYLAIRQVTSMQSTFTDCDHATGSVTVPQIVDPIAHTSKYAIDSHVLGCRLAGTSTDCTPDQSSFVDMNQPIFVPSASTLKSVRVPAGASCEDVRSALP